MPAPQVIIKLKAGVKRDGTLMAIEGDTVLDTGAFSGTVLAVSGVFLASLYKWPAFEIRGIEVLTHKPSVAAYRAPVAPQTIFAIDSHMEQLARLIGMDPVEFRARHLMAPGDPMANGQPWQSNGAKQVLERIAQHPLWKSRKEWAASGNKNGARAPRHRPRPRRLARRPPAHQRDRPPESRRHARRAHRAGRHRGHQHRAGPDRRVGLRRGPRPREDHHRRHRRGAAHRPQRGQQDDLHRGHRGDAGRRGRAPADPRDRARASSRRPSTTWRSWATA